MANKFPARDRTPRFSDRLNRAMIEAASAKGALPDVVRAMDNQRLSAVNFDRTMARLAHLKMELTALINHPGMDDYTMKEIGRNVTADAQTLLMKVEEAQAAIKDLLPVDADGYLRIVKLDTDGTFAWDSFSSAQMKKVRDKLDELQSLIE